MTNYTLEVGKELTHEEHEALAFRLREAAGRPYQYDPDCPLLTPEQLAEFMPVNGMTWEERNRRMKERTERFEPLAEQTNRRNWMEGQ